MAVSKDDAAGYGLRATVLFAATGLALGAGLFGVAALPGRDSAREIRIGMGLFLLAPVLCVIAVFGDYWI